MTTSVQVPSDSEDDEDYVPPQDDSDSSSDERQVKKPKLGSNEPEDTPELDTATRDALWAEFQSSVGQKSQGTATQETKEQVKRMVTFQVAYKFAGETSVHTKEVPEDSDEARAWLSKKATNATKTSSMNEDEASPSVSEPEVSTKPNPEGHSGQDTPVTSSGASSCPAPPKKSRKSLASLAAASKPKKLTMLEKSKMDWNSHLASASSEERNEIEQSRRGGGYLDKVDFLQRVNERREDARDVLKRRR